jgi:Flp pilus assembly protein TadG
MTIGGAKARSRALTKKLARFIGAQDGATAVEFALVATPFFLLLFGIIELAFIFLVSSSLENATAQAARTIRTGELQTAGGATASSFKAAVCAKFGWLQSDCTANLSVDVRTYQTFASVTAPQPVSNGTFNPGALTFAPGGPNDIVVVRTYYQWPLIAPMISQAMQQLSGGKALLTSTAAFRNEPYGSS